MLPKGLAALMVTASSSRHSCAQHASAGASQICYAAEESRARG